MNAEIFTDGACLGNPGPGGWAALIRIGGKQKKLKGGFAKTTNNRMELTAAICGLEGLPSSVTSVDLYSDSRYLVEAMVQGWVENWKSKRWMKSAGKPVPNADLWKRLLSAEAGKKVTWHWVKGHAGHPENELVDRISQELAASSPTAIDPGYAAEDLTETLPLDFSSVDDPLPSRKGGGPVDQVGDPCRKCGTPVIKKNPKRSVKPEQTYYYEYYFLCPSCGTMYLTDKAKRFLDSK
ncbi:MAG TPA: ribonuclease HI [Bellilinea sp.]|nr:ribonuclease HI [Bellilinea sp.]